MGSVATTEAWQLELDLGVQAKKWFFKMRGYLLFV